MNLIDRIQDNFNNGFFGKAMSIPEMPKEYPAWTINERSWFGVAVPIPLNDIFNEDFSNVKIHTQFNVEISGKRYNLLLLTCSNVELRNEFATICSQFIDPGENGNIREELISNPQNWWTRWKVLLGNAMSSDIAYPVLGELVATEYYIKKGLSPTWTGADAATNDIEFTDSSCEVKSTTKRYGKEITISSIFQLKKHGKSLSLIFCRFEKSLLGRSINDLVENLVNLGYNRLALEQGLEKVNLVEGCVARKQKYKLLEMKKYEVDDSFPIVTEESFKNDCLPANVMRFTYTVDLSSLECENLLESGE